MTQIVLIRKDQNSHGRMLVQEDNTLYVLSGCCEARMDSTYQWDGASWVACSSCMTPLNKNDGGWTADVENVSDWAEYTPTAIGSWGKFWFGLDDFNVVVTLS